MIRWRVAVVASCSGLLAVSCGDPTEPPADLPTEWLGVAAGDYHTCALAKDGEAYCWGSNEFGQLGVEDVALTAWPRRVEGDEEFVLLNSGFGHTCGLTADGEAYCWGLGGDGQLGQGSRNNAKRPVLVSGAWRLRDISAGHSHTCGVTFDGDGVCWGDNTYGQLGTGSTGSSHVPVRVSDGGVRFLSVSAGHTHTCGTGATGVTYCWGDNQRAQLGTASFTPTQLPAAVHTPHIFVRISAGFETTCGVTLRGSAHCWGSNDGGRLGVPDVELSGNPIPVTSNVGFNEVSTGGSWHVCGVSWSGTPYCWGRGVEGQLGDGNATGSAIPVAADVDGAFVAISAGLEHTCGVTEEALLYCWGQGASGQLGDGTNQNRPRPVRVGPSR